MTMLELGESTKVRTADGRNLGDVDRFVIDPSTRQVTHVVVERGLFFPDERVIPTEAIARTDPDDGTAVLADRVDPEHLPVFEESHYVDLDPDTSHRLTDREARVTTWAFPYAPIVGVPVYPTVPGNLTRVRERNVPDQTVVVDEGTPVTTADETQIGSVSEVGIADDGALTHIAVDRGFFRSERMIPAHWIESVDDGGVRLALGADTLRDYDAR